MSEYVQQADDFLRKTKTLMECAFMDTAPSGIKSMGSRHCNKYAVTLWNDKGSYEFDYTGSINDFEKGIAPSTYDVLASIHGDTPVCFTDFCDEFDYQIEGGSVAKADEQIRGIRALHHECLSMSAALQKMFTEAELKLLGEIT